MRLLLDTHAMYWYIEGGSQLSGTTWILIQDATNEILISPASYWEMAIKISIGKWQLNRPMRSSSTSGSTSTVFRCCRSSRRTRLG